MKKFLLLILPILLLLSFAPSVCAEGTATTDVVKVEVVADVVPAVVATDVVVPVPEVKTESPLPTPIEEGKVYGFKELIDFAVVFIKNVKIMSPISIAMYILVFLLMILNSSFCKGWFGKRSPLIKRLIIIVLGQVLSVLFLITSGIVWYHALWGGLIISGGAQLLFENVVSLVPEAGKYLKYVVQILGFFKKK